MFVSCLSIYRVIFIFIFFKINQTHTDLEAVLYTYLQTQRLHTRGDFVQDNKFHSDCKEAILEKKHQQIRTPRYKNSTREWSEELHVREDGSRCSLRVFGMNVHTLHTCTLYNISRIRWVIFLNLVLDFFWRDKMQRTKLESAVPIWNVCVYSACVFYTAIRRLKSGVSAAVKSFLHVWP